MDDGDLDFSSMSMGSYFDDVLGDTAEHLACCTHTHTCSNPPADHLPHTHTCHHVHSKFAASASSDAGAETPAEFEGARATSTSRSKKRRPSGNRAAVRKYREKKKEHTAVLQEEAARLRALNEQLVRKVQDHAALETEVARLRCLLVDIRGRIEGEIGTFPYQRSVKSSDFVDQGSFLGGAQVMNSCDFRCNDQLYCNPGMQQARTMDDDGVMSAGQVLGQGAGDSMGRVKPGSLNPPGCRGGQML